MDLLDKQIIEILREDSRITNVQIAKKIKRSESTVRQRVTKLIHNGVIKKFSIVVDPLIFGINTIAFIGVNTIPSKLLKVVKSMKKIDELVSISTTTGAFMIICEAWTEDGSHMADVVDKIEEIDGVEEVFPNIIQENHKE